MQLSKPPNPKATRKRLKKEILSDDFKKRKIFWKNIAENFPPHITSWEAMCAWKKIPTFRRSIMYFQASHGFLAGHMSVMSTV
jgi:hypothetical protein